MFWNIRNNNCSAFFYNTLIINVVGEDANNGVKNQLFMEPTPVPQSAFPDSKQHYAVLDGLRGVASVMVVIFHLLEPLSTGHLDQIINHGYLAVDFFYVLSGFVVAYAYEPFCGAACWWWPYWPCPV